MAKKTTDTSKKTTKTTKKVEKVVLNPAELYTIEAVKDSKHMSKGQLFKVTGEVAQILIDKKLAKVK